MNLERYAKLADSPPLYYRFVYNPSDASVELSHNWEDHPAHVRYHHDLASENEGDNLYHGYAYRIGNGWRLTDWDHKPVQDKFVQAQVIRAIRSQEGHRPFEQTQEEKFQPEFDRFHYGLPANMV